MDRRCFKKLAYEFGGAGGNVLDIFTAGEGGTINGGGGMRENVGLGDVYFGVGCWISPYIGEEYFGIRFGMNENASTKVKNFFAFRI